jgi:DNA polymerase I-like protein with 3'-5' exonuclease and polymerase domains
MDIDSANLVFDIETNGLLDVTDRIHCICIEDVDTGEAATYRNATGYDDSEIQVALSRLAGARTLIGHSIINFDFPAIHKLYPEWEPRGSVYDTHVVSSVIYAHLKELDFRQRKRSLPPKFYGSQTLKAWGYRLGIHKGDFAEETDWAEWSQEMEEYCAQDVSVNVALYRYLTARPYSDQCLALEHRFKELMSIQERNGVGFDELAANKLYGEIEGTRYELEEEIKALFPPNVKVLKSRYWDSPDGQEWATKKEASLHHSAGSLTKGRFKEKHTPINPSSTDQIAAALTLKYGWEPEEFTPSGKPKVTETILAGLSYPEAPLLNKYLMLKKRCSQISSGNEGWMKHTNKGKIHGRVKTNECVTGRCSHSSPNLAQVPAVRRNKEGILYGLSGGYGYECRQLFGPTRSGWVQVGADASGLELRCLAHYLGRWDKGEYAKQILEGDIHSYNQAAAGLPTRDNAKTFIYAWLYGGGDGKIGEIVGGTATHGKNLKTTFMNALPAVRYLKDAVIVATRANKTLTGLDGRKLFVRSEHSALNTLLQSAGAVIMKTAAVLFADLATQAGLEMEVDFALMLNVHDEFQIECKPELADTLGELMVQSIRNAGEDLKLRCPLDGEYKIGMNWAETH